MSRAMSQVNTHGHESTVGSMNNRLSIWGTKNPEMQDRSDGDVNKLDGRGAKDDIGGCKKEGGDTFDDGNLSDESSSSAESFESQERPYPLINYTSLFFFRQMTPPRNLAIKMYSSFWFEKVSMAVILLNCVTLGMFQPCEDRDDCVSRRCHVLEFLDMCISIFFMVEMAVKVLALGCWGEYGYFRDTWNKLDAFIVFSSILEYTINLENVSISAVRTVRVLRPLRAINRVPSLRILVMLLLDTLPMLGNVLMLCFFVFFIFGIIAVQLWAGNLRNRCYLNNSMLSHVNVSPAFELPQYYETGNYPGYGLFICSENKGGTFHCGDLPKWKHGHQYCESTFESTNLTELSLKVMDDYCINLSRYYTNCRSGAPNPFQGAITFDNILLAWVAIFQVISLEGWADIMYIVQDSHSFYDFFYFVFLIVIGAFFMLNLCLVVIATQFSETKRRESRLINEQRAMHRAKSSNSSLSSSFQGPEIGAGCYDEIVALIGHVFRKTCRQAERLVQQLLGRHKATVIPHKSRHSCPIHCRRDQNSAPPNRHTGKICTCSLSNVVNFSDAYYENLSQTFLANRSQTSRKPKFFPPLSAMSKPTLDLPHDSPELSRAATPQIPLASQDNLTLFEMSMTNAPVVGSQPPAQTTVGTLHQRRRSFDKSRAPVKSVSDYNKFRHCRSVDAFHASLNCSKTSLASSDRCSLHPNYNGSLHSCPLACPSSPGNSSRIPEQNEPDSKHGNQPGESKGDCLYKQIKHSDSALDQKDQSTKHHSQIWKFSDVSLPQHTPSKFAAGFFKAREFVDSDYFMYAIFVCILLNTMSMAVEFHQQPEWLTNIVETSNFVFSIIFAIEMLIKLTVYGLLGYMKNGYNLFDGFIVIISLIELFGDSGDGEDGSHSNSSSGLSVLRTFRLLRVLKLVRFMPALRRQLLVMLKTMDNVATFFGLLMLFMFIFSILGMHLFGCKFCHVNELTGERVCDRKNFDSLLWAVITVFQILTQEAWYLVLYNGMSYTHPSAAIYFVALMTFGNYILFNLLVAILVEGFSTDDDKKSRASSSIGGKQDDDQNAKIEDMEYGSEKAAVPEISPFRKTSTPFLGYNEFPHDPNHLYPGNRNRSPSIMGKTLFQNVNSLEALTPKNSSLMPPTIIQTAATPPSFFRSQASDLDLTSDSVSLNIQTEASMPQKEPSVSDRSWLSVPEERRGSSPRVTVMCRPYSADYENTYNLRANGHKRASIAVDNSNLCRVLYDFHLENASYQVTYKLPPAVEKRLSFAMKQHINSLSIPRISSASYASSCSVTPSMPPVLIDTRRPSMMTPGVYSRGGVDSKTSFSSTSGAGRGARNYSDTTMQPMIIATPELVAHLERAQMKSRMKTMTYKLSRIHPCFLHREDHSLYLFSPENSFRVRVQNLITNNWFDYVILVFILANCAAMAMERPTLPVDGPLRKTLDVADLVFTIVFTIEMALKVIAKGLFIGSDAYVKSGWNTMDGILVCISLVDLAFSAITSKENKIFGVLRVFRLLRTLRPLRVISRAPGLKLVVQTLLSSLRPIGNIVLICCTFFIIFGILGVQLFKGTFYHCTGPDVVTVSNKTECLTRHPDNQWLNKKYNFDNLPQALMSLFVLSSKDGWINIMYSGLDAVGVDKQPIKNYNEWRILYFISFLLLVGFFVLNMFVGVVVENFHKVRAEQQAEEAAYKARLLAHKIAKKKRKAMRTPYHTNYGPMRLFIHNLVMSAYFDLAIAAVIIVNVITMSIEHYDMPIEMIHALKVFNYFFTAVFIMESTMKIYALGFFRFIRKRWNKLDLVIVLLSIVGITLEEADTKFLPINPTIIRVMRVFRIARVFKLLKMAKGVRQLLDTVMQALPQVGNLGLLFFLMFFIFAALGVELFGRIECNEDRTCEGLSRHASFQNFGIAYLTLFRIATGDNWNGIMKDTLSTECDASENCRKNCCVSMVIAPIYFVVFVLMAQFVLVNVVVAVLMKHLEESHKQNEENVDKELLFEYMEKLERKERIREEKKLAKKAKKEEKRQKNLRDDDSYVPFAQPGENSGKRMSPVPLASSYRSNESRPISIVKPMIEGKPVTSSGSGGFERLALGDKRSLEGIPACVETVHAEVSTERTPGHQRRAQPNTTLSRMNSLPANTKHKESDRDSDKDSILGVSRRGSIMSARFLGRAESEDKGTQTFECRVNEGRPSYSSAQTGEDSSEDSLHIPGLVSGFRPRSRCNSPCSISMNKKSLPSLEETGDDVETDNERGGNVTKKNPKLEDDVSPRLPPSARPGMLAHQSTQQRRTLVGLKRQQKVEEVWPSDDDEMESSMLTSGFDSNPNLERDTLCSDYEPRTKRAPNRLERNIYRSNTVSVRRMDSLEVPSFHPLGKKVRRKKASSASQRRRESDMQIHDDYYDTSPDIRTPSSGQYRSRRSFSNSGASHPSFESSRVDPATPKVNPVSISVDIEDVSDLSLDDYSASPHPCHVNGAGEPGPSSEANRSRPHNINIGARKCKKQASEESQHSSYAPNKSGAEGHEITPDEHLSSPEMTRKTPADVVLGSKSKFKVDPRSDLPKLRRIPTVAVETSNTSSPSSTPSGSSRKLFSSDSYLNNNQQSKAVQVSPTPVKSDQLKNQPKKVKIARQNSNLTSHAQADSQIHNSGQNQTQGQSSLTFSDTEDTRSKSEC